MPRGSSPGQAARRRPAQDRRLSLCVTTSSALPSSDLGSGSRFSPPVSYQTLAPSPSARLLASGKGFPNAVLVRVQPSSIAQLGFPSPRSAPRGRPASQLRAMPERTRLWLTYSGVPWLQRGLNTKPPRPAFPECRMIEVCLKGWPEKSGSTPDSWHHFLCDGYFIRYCSCSTNTHLQPLCKWKGEGRCGLAIVSI